MTQNNRERFQRFWQQATTEPNCPYPYQQKFAFEEALFTLVNVPTGLGKTAMAVIGWLWRRQGSGKALRSQTPRRLAYCLPMRVLVEQTAECARSWIGNLRRAGTISSDVPVHVLMGGEDEDNWDIHPERDAVIVGTQDMLLSRALNRGYAASRARWPMQFGLLHTDCLWVFDEIQLMGSGLATTSQLEAFRHRLGTKDGHGCHSVWMSATLDEQWLRTVDFEEILKRLPLESRLVFDFEKEIKSDSLDEKGRKSLSNRWTAKKPLQRARATMGDVAALANEVCIAHKPGTRTIVVANTVKRARDLHAATKEQWGSADTERLVLLHSRFRPGDRKSRVEEALAKPPSSGTIIVSTQVIEAGVDIDATTLFTELAPWASLVQRFGRCNRRGERNDDAKVFWVDLPAKKAEAEKVAPPYHEHLDQLRESAGRLTGLDDVGIKSLPKLDLPFEHAHVIRKCDLIDLFDTTPDLAGNDIDIDRYVRDIQDTDVRVYWRNWDMDKSPPNEKTWRRVARDELCPAPVGDFTKFTESKKVRGKVWRWDFLDGEWRHVNDKSDIYPGQTYLVHASAGGYALERGWIGADGKTVAVNPLGPIEPEGLSDDAYDDDGLSKTGSWQTIASHTDDVCRELEEILAILPLAGKEQAALRTAARWHDWGKAHEKFQVKIDDGQELAARDKNGQPQYRQARPEEWHDCRNVAKAPGERVDKQGIVQDPGYWGRITAKDGARRHFRHELASALAVLQKPHDDLRNLSDDDLHLVAYLIAAHHGKVRLSIRSMPRERRPPTANGHPRRFARGVWDDDILPETDLGNGIITPSVTLSLEPMELGLCEEAPFAGQPSWGERMIRLRNTLGPFRMAYLEALLRAADWRASAKAEQPPTSGEQAAVEVDHA